MSEVTSVVEVALELTYPPLEREAMIEEMEAAIEAQVPTGYRLVRMNRDELPGAGPTIRDDLSGSCWRMPVRLYVEEIEPLSQADWEGDGA